MAHAYTESTQIAFELNEKTPSIIFLKYDSAHANPKRHYFECDLMGFTQQQQQ